MSNIQYPTRVNIVGTSSFIARDVRLGLCEQLKSTFASSHQDYPSAFTRVGHWTLIIGYWTLKNKYPTRIKIVDKSCFITREVRLGLY